MVESVTLNCPDCGFEQSLIEQPLAFCNCPRHEGNMWKLHHVGAGVDHYVRLRPVAAFGPDGPLDLGEAFSMIPDGAVPIAETPITRSSGEPPTEGDLRRILVRLGLVRPSWRERLALSIARAAFWLCSKIDPR